MQSSGVGIPACPDNFERIENLDIHEYVSHVGYIQQDGLWIDGNRRDR